MRSFNKRIYFDSEEKNSECTSNRNTLVSLPATFGNLIGLSKLEIIDVKLGDLPESFCELRSLKILDVSRNNLFWLPRTFISLSNLEFCNISRNQFTILDVDFEQMDKLQHLVACFNQISEFPESFLKSRLETLDLYGNKITSVFPEISNMNLRRFDIAGNQVSEAEFAEFCYLEQYQSLQSNLRSSNFEWEFLIKEEYSMDISVLKERIGMETGGQEQSVTNVSSSRYHSRNLDFSFSSMESDDDPLACLSEDYDQEEEERQEDQQSPPGNIQAPGSRDRTQEVTTEEIDSHQFDDADYD